MVYRPKIAVDEVDYRPKIAVDDIVFARKGYSLSMPLARIRNGLSKSLEVY